MASLRTLSRSTWLLPLLPRVAGSLLIVLALTASAVDSAGAEFQTAATDREVLGESGNIAIGDRSLFVQCQGVGEPLVVLESGLGGTVDGWSNVQPEIARHTRVCAYDRAGLGQSNPDDDIPHSASDASRDLHALMMAMQGDEPIVLVGFSIGGLLARHYASAYPDDVAALVLIDPTPPVWTAMALSGYAPQSRADRLLEFSGLDPDEPERLDILKAGEEVFTGPLPTMPVYMLTSGIKSTNPGMYGDQRRHIAAKLQDDQARELDAEHEIAELCTHQLPVDCAGDVVAFIERALDETAPSEAAQQLTMLAGDSGRTRRKAHHG
jgi:pimeloyl-ACP methyl ester carboxylesterase